MWLGASNVPRLACGTILYRIKCNLACECQLTSLSLFVAAALELIRPFSQSQSSLGLRAHGFVILWPNRPGFRMRIVEQRHGVVVVAVVWLFRSICGVAPPNRTVIVIPKSMEFDFNALRIL